MAAAGLPAILSYAGRTEAPRAQPVPVRVGGFGGAEGLARWLATERIGRVVDATHPFAARISANAVAACARAGVPLLALERPPWQPGPCDRWTTVPDLAGAVGLLAEAPPGRIFLAIGRQNLADFAGVSRHHYLVRLVDAPREPLPLANCTVEIARGPFDATGDRALLERHRITHIVAKNAGGAGAEAKLAAARALSLPVIMIARPVLPGITAMLAAAAAAGAPLGHDFCAINLSDNLKPFDLVLRRIRLAAEGDFAMAFYNPRSKSRPGQFAEVLDLLRQVCGPERLVIFARAVSTPGQQIRVATLAEAVPEMADMRTVVLVGSSLTRRVGRFVYTPRSA